MGSVNKYTSPIWARRCLELQTLSEDREESSASGFHVQSGSAES